MPQMISLHNAGLHGLTKKIPCWFEVWEQIVLLSPTDLGQNRPKELLFRYLENEYV